MFVHVCQKGSGGMIYGNFVPYIYRFIIKDKDTFFTNAQRSKIVYEILARTWFEHDKKGKKRIGEIHI